MSNPNTLHTSIVIQGASNPWYVELVNYLVCGILPPSLDYYQKKGFKFKARDYYWDAPFLYKRCQNHILRRCAYDEKIPQICQHFHASPYGRHFGVDRTTSKVLQTSYCWSTFFKDVYTMVRNCNRC